MASATDPTSKTSNRSFGRLAIRGVLILTLLSLVGYLGLNWAIERRLGAARELHTMDLSLEFLDYQPAELPEGSRNATDYFEAATLLSHGQSQSHVPNQTDLPPLARQLRELQVRFRELDITGQPIGPGDLDTARSVVEAAQLPLTILDAAVVEASGARFDANFFEVPANIRIPNLLARLRFASLLRARALIALQDGEVSLAWRDAASIFEISAWTAEEMPTLIHALIARAMYSEGKQLTRTLLASGTGDPDTEQTVLAAARRSDPRAFLDLGMAAERAASFSTLIDLRSQHAPSGDLVSEDEWQSSHPIERSSLFLRLNAAMYLETASTALKHCLRPSFETIGSEDEANFFGELDLPLWASQARRLIYDCSGIGHKRDLWIAAADQVELGFRLEGYRREHGAYPESLTDLAGDLPIDQFSGQTYRYRLAENGYFLYSVSVNGVDDGGTIVPPPSEGHHVQDHLEGDFVWRLVKEPKVAS